MRVSQPLAAGGVIALLALLAVGLVELSSQHSSTQTSAPPLTVAQMRVRLAGSPAPLASLHVQSGELLGGGLAAVRARLSALHGAPLVINKWASWCAPCRSEFAAFARASVSLGRSVAFLGIDSGDSARAAGASFLRAHPVAYPSYYDPSGEAGGALRVRHKGGGRLRRRRAKRDRPERRGHEKFAAFHRADDIARGRVAAVDI